MFGVEKAKHKLYVLNQSSKLSAAKLIFAQQSSDGCSSRYSWLVSVCMCVFNTGCQIEPDASLWGHSCHSSMPPFFTAFLHTDSMCLFLCVYMCIHRDTSTCGYVCLQLILDDWLSTVRSGKLQKYSLCIGICSLSDALTLSCIYLMILHCVIN